VTLDLLPPADKRLTIDMIPDFVFAFLYLALSVSLAGALSGEKAGLFPSNERFKPKPILAVHKLFGSKPYSAEQRLRRVWGQLGTVKYSK